VVLFRWWRAWVGSSGEGVAVSAALLVENPRKVDEPFLQNDSHIWGRLVA
jgi:hypothetical protein